MIFDDLLGLKSGQGSPELINAQLALGFDNLRISWYSIKKLSLFKRIPVTLLLLILQIIPNITRVYRCIYKVYISIYMYIYIL